MSIRIGVVPPRARKSPADGEPIFSGEPDIQNDEVVFVDREQGECCCSGHGEVGGPGRFLKYPDQELAQGGIILDDKKAHEESIVDGLDDSGMTVILLPAAEPPTRSPRHR